MIFQDPPFGDAVTKAEIARLTAELKRLRGGAKTQPTTPKPKGQRVPRVVLTPRYTSSTIPGSIYSTVLKTMADRGRLAIHPSLFAEFAADPNPASAKRLLRKMGVFQKELVPMIRKDAQFKIHCAKRTNRLRSLAARGDRKSKGVLQNRSICNARGRWIGDIDEAFSVYTGAEKPETLDRLKNVRHLKRMRLMWARTQRNGKTMCYLYPREMYRQFVKARALAGE